MNASIANDLDPVRAEASKAACQLSDAQRSAFGGQVLCIRRRFCDQVAVRVKSSGRTLWAIANTYDSNATPGYLRVLGIP